MSRPQVGIDRLPARRMSNEPKEAMNCKSCRKRKIKCNRSRPACEACQVFACPCIYDAVPKKRGPKTDVLEALLKRVDGLEKRLHSEGKSEASPDHEKAPDFKGADETDRKDGPLQQPLISIPPNIQAQTALISPVDQNQQQSPSVSPDLLLDTYFARLHGKPYYILDEVTTRQRLQLNQLPTYLVYAIYGLSARYTPIFGDYNAGARMGQEYARRARMEMDIDEPSIEAIQALLLLAQASFQAGKGKKAYMLLSSGISMALALNLHRELPLELKVPPSEREGRRRLFWSCYLLDRFGACGSKRPSLISDESIALRLPSWQPRPGAIPVEGEFFPSGLNLQYLGSTGKPCPGSAGMLIGITRILGVTSRYLAAGGVKGDSHFPWHSSSTLSKIRHLLGLWASETQDTFASLENVFGQPDSISIVLSKLIYHLIHCLIYRPFLPVDLSELSGTGQHQSWQIEATNLCFLHANAIAELVEIGKASSIIDWPAFVGYCVCTAGTIHVHGAHYRGREGEVFSTSGEFLSREMQQLGEFRMMWAGVQHQRDTLQTIYGCHSELVKSLASNPMRFSPVFHLEDFFDRYPGQYVDGAHLSFAELAVDVIPETITPYTFDPNANGFFNPDLQNMSTNVPQLSFLPHPQLSSQPQHKSDQPRSRKRRATNASLAKNADLTPATAEDQSAPQAGSARPTDGGDSSEAQNQPAAPTPKPYDMQNSLGSLSAFSPQFSFNGLPSAFQTPQPSGNSEMDPPASANVPPNEVAATGGQGADPLFGIPATPYDPQEATPSASGSTHTDPDKDPFLTLLEQLAESEHSRGGPSELDFFLGNGGSTT